MVVDLTQYPARISNFVHIVHFVTFYNSFALYQYNAPEYQLFFLYFSTLFIAYFLNFKHVFSIILCIITFICYNDI